MAKEAKVKYEEEMKIYKEKLKERGETPSSTSSKKSTQNIKDMMKKKDSTKKEETTDLLSTDSPTKRKNKLPKPLAPMPLVNEQNDRPSSLNLPDPIHMQQQQGDETLPIEPQPSPITFINSKDMSVSFSKEREQLAENDVIETELDNTNRGLSRSETDPDILKTPNEPPKLPLTPQPDSASAADRSDRSRRAGRACAGRRRQRGGDWPLFGRL